MLPITSQAKPTTTTNTAQGSISAPQQPTHDSHKDQFTRQEAGPASEAPGAQTNLLDLGPDLLSYLVSKVDKETRKSIRETNTVLYTAINDSVKKYRIYGRLAGRAQLLFPSAARIELEGATDAQFARLYSVDQASRKISELVIINPPKLNSISSLPERLKEIELKRITSVDLSLLSRLNNLKELTIKYAYRVTLPEILSSTVEKIAFEDLREISSLPTLSSLTNLISLKLNTIHDLEALPILPVQLSYLTLFELTPSANFGQLSPLHLRSLTFWPNSEEHWRAIMKSVNIPMLQELDLAGPALRENLQPSQLQSLSLCTNLQDLKYTIRGNRAEYESRINSWPPHVQRIFLDGHRFSAAHPFPSLSNLSNLVFLDIVDCEINEKIYFPSNIRHLEMQAIRYQPNAPAEFDIPNLGSLEKLETLYISQMNLPPRLAWPPNLRDLYHNLARPPQTPLPPSLRELDYDEYCTAWQFQLKTLHQLEKLRIYSDFHSSHLTYFDLPRSLKAIDMKANRLISLPALAHLSRLTEMKTHNCYIRLRENNDPNASLRSSHILDRIEKIYIREFNAQIEPLLTPGRNLRKLELANLDNVLELPQLISATNLTTLRIELCKDLRTIPRLPTSLQRLRINNLISLQSISDLDHLKELSEVSIQQNPILMELPRLPAHLNPSQCAYLLFDPPSLVADLFKKKRSY